MGNFARFLQYTGQLTWFVPHAMIPALAVLATCAEIVAGSFTALRRQAAGGRGGHRAAGTPRHTEDMGKVAAFLASDDSGYVNGIELFADGGVAQI